MSKNSAGSVFLIVSGLVLLTACPKKEHASVGPLPLSASAPTATLAPTLIPAADNCPGFDLGTLVAFPVVIYGDTTGATNSTASCNGGSSDNIFQFTLAAPANITISTCSEVTNFDTTLALGSACGLIDVMCDDDSCILAGLGATTTLVFTPLLAGTYWITVDGFSTNVGIYELTITSP